MLMKHLRLPAQLQVKLISLTTNLILVTNAWFIFYPVTVVKSNTWGQTVDEFRFRWSNYKSNCRKHQRGETCMQQYLCEHFCSSNHNCFISDVSVIFIDKTDPSDPLKREDY